LTQEELLVRVAQALQQCGIPSMLVGSHASSLHGMPRTTIDVDMVIDPTLSQLEQLLRLLPESEYYVSREAALEALEHRSQFNVIDINGVWKVDLNNCQEPALRQISAVTPRTALLWGCLDRCRIARGHDYREARVEQDGWLGAAARRRRHNRSCPG
jgi:hypothetical protein